MNLLKLSIKSLMGYIPEVLTNNFKEVGNVFEKIYNSSSRTITVTDTSVDSITANTIVTNNLICDNFSIGEFIERLEAVEDTYDDVVITTTKAPSTPTPTPTSTSTNPDTPEPTTTPTSSSTPSDVTTTLPEFNDYASEILYYANNLCYAGNVVSSYPADSFRFAKHEIFYNDSYRRIAGSYYDDVVNNLAEYCDPELEGMEVDNGDYSYGRAYLAAFGAEATTDQIQTYLRAVKADYPEFWFLDDKSDAIMDSWANVYYAKCFKSQDPSTYLNEMRYLLADKTNNYHFIMLYVSDYNNSYDKVENIHDMMCKNIILTKDETDCINSTIYGALIRNKSTAEGIARAVNYCLIQSNVLVQSILVEGERKKLGSSDEWEHHWWNYVLIDNEWYILDVATDIEYTSGIDTAYTSGSSVSHARMMCSFYNFDSYYRVNDPSYYIYGTPEVLEAAMEYEGPKYMGEDEQITK